MPALDAQDPGPSGDYPHPPREAEGTLDTLCMPTGLRRQLTPDGRVVLIEVEPTTPGGRRPREVLPPAP
ncbi:MAG: hypothetical protein M3P91_11845 [Actinomycetota bacterium]|nr:hypothetical protein [Actinomycetota bacterium]